MRKIAFLSLTLLFAANLFAKKNVNKNIYSFKLQTPKDTSIDLNSFKGSPFLIVNIATRCGYTGQLDDLEALYKKYKDKGFKILAIPSNDFGSQTPENDKEVVKMCRLKYGATFPISTKQVVLGEKKHELIKYVLKQSKGEEIAWNFEKFLFDKSGKFVSRFTSSEKPLGTSLERTIKNLLN